MRDGKDEGPIGGCLILVIFGCAAAGGLLFFVKCIISMCTGRPI